MVGEYQVEHRDGGYSVIRHCPWCGGAAPRSRRASLFAVIPSAELRRLERLTASVRTVEDALETFGAPERRERQGLMVHTPGSGRRPARVETFPTMTFTKLSKVADVTVNDYGPKGVGFTFSPKYLGRPNTAPSRRRSTRRPRR